MIVFQNNKYQFYSNKVINQMRQSQDCSKIINLNHKKRQTAEMKSSSSSNNQKQAVQSSNSLVKALSESATFSYLETHIHSASRAFLGKVQPIELMRSNLLDLVQNFIESKFTDMSLFIPEYFRLKFKKGDQATIQALTLFFSLESHSQDYLDIRILRDLFKSHKERKYYLLFQNIKKIFSEIRREKQSNYISFDNIMLKHSEVFVLTDRINKKSKDKIILEGSQQVQKVIQDWLSQLLTDLKQFRKEIRNGNLIYKEQVQLLEAHVKPTTVSLSILILKMINLQEERDSEQREIQQQLANEPKNEYYNESERLGDVIIVEDEEIIKQSKVQIQSQIQQKESYLQEIRRLNKETNQNRDALLKLVGLMKVLDPISDNAQKITENIRKKLLPMKKKIVKDEDQRQMFAALGLEGFRFFNTGSKMKLEQQEKMRKTLVTKNVIESRDVMMRSKAYATHMSKYRDDYKKKINNQVNIFRKKPMNTKEKNMANFEEIKKGIQEQEQNQSQYQNMKHENMEQDAESIDIYGNQNEVSQIISEDVDNKFEEFFGRYNNEEGQEDDESIIEIADDEINYEIDAATQSKSEAITEPKTEPKLGEDKPDEAKQDEAKPDEAKPDEAKPDEAKSDEVKAEETGGGLNLDEIKAEDVTNLQSEAPTELKSENIEPVEIAPSQADEQLVKAEEVTAPDMQIQELKEPAEQQETKADEVIAAPVIEKKEEEKELPVVVNPEEPQQAPLEEAKKEEGTPQKEENKPVEPETPKQESPQPEEPPAQKEKKFFEAIGKIMLPSNESSSQFIMDNLPEE